MNSSQKIAFVTSGYVDSNFSSGGVKLNYILIKELYQQNYTIDLFCDYVDCNHNYLFSNIYKLENFNNLKKNYDCILSDNAFIPSDITYIHNHSYIFRVKYMSNPLNHFFYKIFNRKKHLKRFNEYLTIKDNLKRTKTVVVSSKILKKDIIENFEINPNNIAIIPPPIEPALLCKKEKEIFTFGISAIGFKRKGGYLLLEAIHKLKKENKKFKVIFIYNSYNFIIELVKKLYSIENYCEFIKLQKNMSNFYNSIDCLLMPSLIEPFGMVATEALSHGCPVITAKHCGAADFITDKQNGFLYNGLKNPDKELANAMKNILSLDKKQLKKMSQNCIESVKECNKTFFTKKYIDRINTINK